MTESAKIVMQIKSIMVRMAKIKNRGVFMTTPKQLNKTLGNRTKKVKQIKKKKPTTNTTAMLLDTINSTHYDNLTITPPLNLTNFENNTYANQSATHHKIIAQESNSSLFGTVVGVTATAFLFFSCCLRRHKKQLQAKEAQEFKDQAARIYAVYSTNSNLKV